MATHMNNANPSLSGPSVIEETTENKKPEIPKPIVEVTKAEDFFLSSSKSLLGKRTAQLNPEVQFEQRSSSEKEIPEDEKTTLAES